MTDGAGGSPEPVRLSEVLEAEYASLGLSPPPPAANAKAGGAGDEGTRLRELFRRVHQAERPLSALCISGGGIRSATFAWGALQGLAARGLLPEFDYVSTVSGGGYIGSWLSAWIHRAPGLARVVSQLNGSSPPPVEHLREYNSYLTPRLGLASGDTSALAAIIARNLLLNWLLLAPLLMAALMAPRILVSLLQVCPPGRPDPFPGFDLLQYLVLAAGVLLYGVSTFNTFGALPSMGRRPLDQGRFLATCFIPLVLSAFLLVVGFWWAWDDLDRVPTFSEMAGAGVLLSLVSWLVSLAADRLRDGTPAAKRPFGPLGVAGLVFGFCSGAGAYLLTHVLFKTAQNRDDPSFYASLAPPLFLGGLLLGQALAAGFTSRTLGEPDREWLARAGGFVLLALGGWLALCTIVLVIPHVVFAWGTRVHSALAAAGGIAGWITARFGAGTPAPGPPTAGAGPSAPGRAAAIVRKAALPLFLLVLLLALTMLTNGIVVATGAVEASPWDHHHVVEGASLAATLGLTLALLVLALVLGRFINVNTFSLHAMYKDRLVRAYLAASNAGRRPSPFTGLCETDDIAMQRLRGQRPLHLLNLTLNLVSGRNLAWQQRKAESFSVSALHAGSRPLGYRDSAAYGGSGGITLGTAMAISGAAASPNMGYASSPLVGFTMMLFNARLGWWLGNPGPAGRQTWHRDGPGSAVGAVLREMLGLTDDTSRWVYLSDGGHFENLALYEMVLRRCRTIVVLDGGCDPDFTYEDLGNALRKVRIDFGIPIEFEAPFEFGAGGLGPLRDRKKRCAVARIRYSAVDEGAEDGVLVYLKPVLLGSEPPDVRSYAAAHPTFPHETTANQWFNEAQTESYRMLGERTVAELSEGWGNGTLAEWTRHVAGTYQGGAS